jgi:hypothetical protein
MELAIGTSFPIVNLGDFDSPDKPLAKKRGISGLQEIMKEGVNIAPTSCSDEDMVVTKVTMPPVASLLPKTPHVEAMSTSDSAFLPVIVVVRLTCGTLTESVLIVFKDTIPMWPTLLVKKRDWVNKRVVKIALHKELAGWLPIMDSSLRHLLIKLYHWNMVYSKSEPGLHLVVLTLHPQFTKYTRRWKPAYRFYAPQLLHNFESLDPRWGFMEKLPMTSQYATEESYHE